MIQWKLILAAVVLAALGGLLWHDHHQTQRANRLAKELNQAEQTIQIERDNLRKANEATKREQGRQDALERERRDNPLPPVIVYRSPRVSATCPGATVTAGTTEANDSGEDAGDSGRDIGPALDDFATDSESNLIQCQELMEWVRGRAH